MRKIKNKILGSAILIVTLSLTSISAIAYERFSSILETQALREDSIHLEQTTNQLNQLVDDVQKYAANMVNDELLQGFAHRVHYPSTYDELSAYRNVITQLTKFNVLRDYLQSSAIIRTDGKVFWSSLYLDPYFDQLLHQSWYVDATAGSAKSGFTVPHEIEDRGTKKVISFFIRFDPEFGGVLLLNIDFAAFYSSFDYLANSFDQVAWIGQGGSFLYNRGVSLPMNQLPLQRDQSGITVTKHNKGYYLSSLVDKTDWEVVTFTSKARFYEWLGYIIKYWAIFLALCLALCFLLFLPIVSSIVRPISQMSKAMKQVSMGNYNVALSFRSKDELSVLRSGFEIMLREIQRQMAEKMEHERWQRRMSAELLFAQINPHFIYNTLNTVVYLARKGNHRAIEDMVESFIGILQDAVKIGDEGLYVTVSGEMDIIDHYVAIQRFRYADRFLLKWDVEDEARSALIPRSLLQPLVENAIYHGFSEKEEVGRIEIAISQAKGQVTILVKDDGIGMEPEKARSVLAGIPQGERHKSGGMKAIGLANIRDRIHYLYGEAGRITIESELDAGTCITIEIPAGAVDSPL